MDVKDIAIEELNSKFIGVEREKNKLKRDLDQSNGEQSKVRCGVMINVGKVIDCINKNIEIFVRISVSNNIDLIDKGF